MRTADDARTSDETRARSELNIRVSVVELVVAWLLIFGLVTSIGVLITKVFEPTQPIYGEDRINRWLQSFRTPTWDTVTAVGSFFSRSWSCALPSGGGVNRSTSSCRWSGRRSCS